jgi:hypothetical protein
MRCSHRTRPTPFVGLTDVARIRNLRARSCATRSGIWREARAFRGTGGANPGTADPPSRPAQEALRMPRTIKNTPKAALTSIAMRRL